MGSLADHQSLTYVKGLYLGDSGAGKTGSLTSLVKAGYKLRIWDFDNLLGTLVQYVKRECPEKLDSIKFQTFTDKLKGTDSLLMRQGNSVTVMSIADGMPTAYVNALKQLNHWKTPTEDLGPPSEWGKDCVIVIDTLTTMASAAFRYCQAFNPGAKEPQTYYWNAQQLVTNMLSLLNSEQMHVNVLVLAHINYDKNYMEITKGFPRSIGSALNDQIAASFNCVVLAESRGSQRVIRTNSTGIIDLKNPVAFKVPETLPLETGLATFFEAVKS